MPELKPCLLCGSERIEVIRSREMDELWPKCGWTPVTEALPEKRQMVLMYYKNGDMYVGYVTAVHSGWGVWYARNVNSPGMTLVCDPVFWMPIPEPPEND